MPQKLQYYQLMRLTRGFHETLASFITWIMYIGFLALFEYGHGCKITQDNDTLRNFEKPDELMSTASEVHNT